MILTLQCQRYLHQSVGVILTFLGPFLEAMVALQLILTAFARDSKPIAEPELLESGHIRDVNIEAASTIVLPKRCVSK